MIFSALAFLSGILLVQQFSALPDIDVMLALAVGAVILASLRCWRLLLFVLGIIWTITIAEIRLAERLPERLAGTDLPITGVIAELPEQSSQQARFDFLVEDSAQPLPDKLRLSWYHTDAKVKAGQHWAFTVRLKPPHGSLNPGGFDYERWLFTENIGATGHIRPYPAPVLLGQDPPWRNVEVIRQIIGDRLAAAMSDSGLIKALTIGDGSGISQAQWAVFRKTGTIHLIVISGSHIGLIAGLVYFLVLKCWAWTGWLTWSPQRVAAGAAVLVGTFYAALAGFSVPSQRAVVMLMVIMLAIIQQRHVRPFNTLAVALVAVLLYDPLSVLSPGFWLSFLAVAVIVYAVAGRLGKAGYVAEALKINWVTSLGLSPLLLWFFQQVSLCSPLANFIAVPVIGLLIVPLALLAVLLLFMLPDLAKFLLLSLDYVLQGLLWLLTKIAMLPLATVNHPQPSYSALLFAAAGLLLLLAPKGIPNRWLGLVMLLPMAVAEPKKPAVGTMEMTLLDVGQGLAVAVQTANHWLVYDTGAKFSAESDSGSTVLIPFFSLHGVTKLNSVIISHGDNDHIGGAASLLQAIPTDQLLTSAPQQLNDYAPTVCKAGQSWTWDEVSFTILSPGPQPFASDNDNSCVLKITANHGSVLLTGDIERTAESWLLEQYGEKLQSEILIAPHHGSKTSSSGSFLQAVKPSTVLIPSGYRNPFGHPHAKVLGRYREINTTWLNTADSGAIIVSGKNNAFNVQVWREFEGKYWNWQVSRIK